MRVRQGNPEDLAAVRTLGLAVWSRYKSELTDENWTRLHQMLSNRKTYEELLSLNDSFICENDANEIVGFSFLVRSGNPTELFSEDQAYIRYLTVSDAYRGQQLGQMLTEKCIQRARETGERYLALHTSEMMHAARHVYEKLGFKILRQIEPRLGKQYWIYQLTL